MIEGCRWRGEPGFLRVSATLWRRALAGTVVGETGTRRANWVAVGLEDRLEDVAVRPADEASREALLALSNAGSDFESMAVCGIEVLVEDKQDLGSVCESGVEAGGVGDESSLCGCL